MGQRQEKEATSSGDHCQAARGRGPSDGRCDLVL